MQYAILKGLIGLAIGTGLVTLMSLIDPLPWSFTQMVIGFGIAGFCGPFFTALDFQNKKVES